MTATIVGSAPVLDAARDHHDELRSRLAERAGAFIDAVASGTGSALARDRLETFLRNDLLPHTRVEDDLFFSSRSAPVSGVLMQVMRDEHRMIAELAQEIENATSPMDAAVAAGALVVLCDVRIEQENRHLLPTLLATGLDLGRLLADHPEIVGAGSPSAPASRAGLRRRVRSLDISGLDFYNRRHRVHTALGALQSGEELRLVSDRAGDLGPSLRFQMEEWLPQRFEWSTVGQENGLSYVLVSRP